MAEEFFKNNQSLPAKTSGLLKIRSKLGVMIAVILVVGLAQNLYGRIGEIQQYFSDLEQWAFKVFLGKSSSPTPVQFKNSASPLPVLPQVASYEEQITRVVEYANPSVVSIIVSKDLPIIEQYFVNPFEDWGLDVPEGFGIPQYRQKGTQKQEIGGGTGFVVSSNGLIVTNKHVASDTLAEYTVLFNDSTKISAQVISKDPVLDLAVLRVAKTGLTPLALGDSSKLKLGQTVIAIGNSLGEFRNTVSVGVVSGLGRSLQIENEMLTDLIQTDAAINRGNSGGPLLNLRGEVIGINTAMALGAENIGFTIPINQVKKSIIQVETSGVIKTSYLGVRYVLINSDLQKKNNLPVDYGAWVYSNTSEPAIVPGSPAQKAGLKQGDIILELNQEKITVNSPLTVLLKKYEPGETITLKILRDEKETEIKITLGER
jgi:serine protease Do